MARTLVFSFKGRMFVCYVVFSIAK